MDMSIAFPNLGIYFDHVGKSIHIFGIEIAYYGIVIAIGMLLGVALVMLEVRRTGQNEDFYFYTVLLALLIGIVGARVYYVVFSWSYYSQHPAEILAIRNGGLAIYGGIIFGILTVIVCGRVRKVSILLMMDTICIGVPLGQMIGRWGNFFNREAFGNYTNNLLAMRLPVDAVRSNEITEKMWEHVQVINGTEYVQVHPTFLYESMWDFGVLLLVLWVSRHKKWTGQTIVTYLGAYALGRVWIESLRTDQLLIPYLGLPVSQVLSAVLLLVCLGIYIYHFLKGRQKRDTL